MRRRTLITLLGAASLGVATRRRRAYADKAEPPRIGLISGLDQAAASGFIDNFRDGLRAYGYVEPRTITIDLLFANYAPEHILGFVAELEKRRVDVIVTHAGATQTIVKAPRSAPVIYEFSADPVTLGIASDLAHPLYNATGISLMLAETNSKRLELLREIEPNSRRIAVLANPLHPGEHLERKDSEAKARQLGLRISYFPTPNRGELDHAIAAMDAERPDGLLLFSDAFIVENRHQIINFAMSRRIPVISGWAVMAESGALCTYGPRQSESYRRVAYFVDRILRGAKPRELPIEQPTVLELVINLSSAKTLGVTIPPALLARADRVIE
jgi:putative ABC transport system substrate-binding protein